MSIAVRRPLVRSWPVGHRQPWITPAHHAAVRTGGAVCVSLGPAGPVGPTATGLSYNGMDPSDPTSYVRPYNPQPGMVGRFNYDGAQPNRTQTV